MTSPDSVVGKHHMDINHLSVVVALLIALSVASERFIAMLEAQIQAAPDMPAPAGVGRPGYRRWRDRGV